MNIAVELLGQSFGRLVVVGRAPNDGRFTRWNCKCACGADVIVRTASLRTSNTASCGCLRADELSSRRFKHGAKGSAEYTTWILMRDRCNNKNNGSFAYYGGIGVKVCPRWDDFKLFLADMGEKPSATHSIDRIKHDIGYEPSNCRWATKKEQARNRRITKKVIVGGIERPIAEWAELSGLSCATVSKRLSNGWKPERALSQQESKK